MQEGCMKCRRPRRLECKADLGLTSVCVYVSEVTDPGVSSSLQLKRPSCLCDATCHLVVFPRPFSLWAMYHSLLRMKRECSCCANEASLLSPAIISVTLSISREKQGRKGKRRFGADHLTQRRTGQLLYQLVCKVDLGNGCYPVEFFCTQSFYKSY